MPTVAVVHRPKVPGRPEKYTAEDVKVVKEMIKEAVDLSVGGIDNVIMPGQRVLVKPNCVFPAHPEASATTDPRVIEALVSLIKESVKPVWVTVGENPSLNFEGKRALKVTGVGDAAWRGGADEVIAFDDYAWVEMNVPKPKAFVKVKPKISKAVLDADFVISVPKMKTHHAALVTLSLKNWQGIIANGPDQQYGYHREDLHQKIVELQKIAPADLAVIDGIIAAEKQGVWMGSSVEMNLILAGKDLLAVDSVASAIMGIEPEEVPHLRIAKVEGIGVGDLDKIEVKGKQIEEVKHHFKRPIYSPVGFAPNVDIYISGACLGCIQTIRGALDNLEMNKIPHEKAGRICFVCGYNAQAPNLFDPLDSLERGPPTIFIVGDCLPKEIREEYKGKEGVYDCPGCPPLHLYTSIAERIIPKIIEERESSKAIPFKTARAKPYWD